MTTTRRRSASSIPRDLEAFIRRSAAEAGDDEAGDDEPAGDLPEADLGEADNDLPFEDIASRVRAGRSPPQEYDEFALEGDDAVDWSSLRGPATTSTRRATTDTPRPRETA